MFTQGQPAGVIQPYFLSQIDTSFSKSVKIDSGSNKNQVQAQAQLVASAIADYIAGAKQRLDIAIYDFRLSEGPVHDTIVGAINIAAKRGVSVRIAYDKDQEDKTPGTIDDFIKNGSDPAPDGTNQFVEDPHRFDKRVARKGITDIQTEGIDPQHHIMHQKYILRDALTPNASLLMGSANFTLDAWAAQENNILILSDVPTLVQMYANDFGEMWTSGVIGSTGVDDSGEFNLDGTDVRVSFAPGQGTAVEGLIASTIAGATNRLYVASMVISSGKIMRAIMQAMTDVHEFGGLCDGGSMAGVKSSWNRGKAKSTHSTDKSNLTTFSSAEKAAMWEKLEPHFHEKKSLKYSDSAPHNLMHDKVAVVDDTVITGSFNFSNNAMKNAENILAIHDADLADQYATYIQGLLKRYP